MIPLLAIALAHAGPPGVVGGDAAPPGVWDDAAAVVYPWGVSCMGTLIAPDLVLTAAHCAYGIESVVVATTDYTQGGETVPVSEVIAYPTDDDFDVAIAILATEATTAPRPIALDCIAAEQITDGATVAIVGYGAHDSSGDEYDSTLRQAYTTIADADCGDPDRGCRESVSPGGELIAGGDGVDSCNGDSGGPLYLETDAGTWLVGVTSRASQPADEACGDGGIYVRADAVAEWIEQTTGRLLPRPECDGTPNEPPSPSAEPIEVYAGHMATTVVLPNDPDDGNLHSYTVDGTHHGQIDIDAAGTLTYRAAEDFLGTESLEVVVTDNGYPQQSAVTSVQVTVLPDPADEVLVAASCANAPPMGLGSVGIGVGYCLARPGLRVLVFLLGKKRGALVLHRRIRASVRDLQLFAADFICMTVAHVRHILVAGLRLGARHCGPEADRYPQQPLHAPSRVVIR